MKDFLSTVYSMSANEIPTLHFAQNSIDTFDFSLSLTLHVFSTKNLKKEEDDEEEEEEIQILE